MFLQKVASPKKMIDDLLAGVFLSRVFLPRVFLPQKSWTNSTRPSSVPPCCPGSSPTLEHLLARRSADILTGAEATLMATSPFLGCRWGVPILSILSILMISILSISWSPSSLNPQQHNSRMLLQIWWRSPGESLGHTLSILVLPRPYEWGSPRPKQGPARASTNSGRSLWRNRVPWSRKMAIGVLWIQKSFNSVDRKAIGF